MIQIYKRDEIKIITYNDTTREIKYIVKRYKKEGKGILENMDKRCYYINRKGYI